LVASDKADRSPPVDFRLARLSIGAWNLVGSGVKEKLRRTFQLVLPSAL